jgi:hypothetical protein
LIFGSITAREANPTLESQQANVAALGGDEKKLGTGTDGSRCPILNFPRNQRAYIELFFRSVFRSSVVAALGLLAQLIKSELMRSSPVIAINLFFIAPLYASGMPSFDCCL